MRSQQFVLTQHDYGVNYDDSDDDERLWLLYLCMLIRVCFVFWCVCASIQSQSKSHTTVHTHTRTQQLVDNDNGLASGQPRGDLGHYPPPAAHTHTHKHEIPFYRCPSHGNPFCSQAGRLREAPDATSSDAAVNCDCCEIQAHHNAPMHKSNTHGSKDYRTHTHARAPTRTAQTHTHINTRAHCL